MYETVECRCGQQARVVICGVGAYVNCTYCGAGTYMCETKEKAVRLFNEKNGGQKDGRNQLPEDI